MNNSLNIILNNIPANMQHTHQSNACAYLKIAATLASLMFACSAVIAQVTGVELGIKLHLERSTLVDGKEKMLATERAAPGETLHYVAVYSNQTHSSVGTNGKVGANERVLKAISATLPIPEQMVYLGKASPTPQLGSSDGKVFANYPLSKMVKQADGSFKTTPLDWSEYRALRWTLPGIQPKSATNVSAVVQVKQQMNDTTTATKPK